MEQTGEKQTHFQDGLWIDDDGRVRNAAGKVLKGYPVEWLKDNQDNQLNNGEIDTEKMKSVVEESKENGRKWRGGRGGRGGGGKKGGSGKRKYFFSIPLNYEDVITALDVLKKDVSSKSRYDIKDKNFQHPMKLHISLLVFNMDDTKLHEAIDLFETLQDEMNTLLTDPLALKLHGLRTFPDASDKNCSIIYTDIEETISGQIG